MKRLLVIAAFLLASGTAQAQYTFEYGGHTIRIDPDRGTVSIPGVYDNTGTPKKARHPHGNQENARSKQGPQDAKNDTKNDTKSDPQASPAPAPADTAAAPTATPPAAPAPAPASTAAIAPSTSTATANNAPAETAVAPPPPPAPAQPLLKEPVSPPRPEPSPAIAAVPPSTPAQPAPAASRDPNSPVGVWLTEEKEGKVRIEQCGTNLCGYSVDTKSNVNGEQVLINMRPGKDQKWSGRILDPNTGSTYDSTIALKGSETLRVQGCAFGGMFCGGQTWTRVN